MDIDKIKKWFGWYIVDEGESQIELARIAGGLVLPAGRNPGFGVLVAVERFENIGFSCRRIHTLAEFEEYDTDTLIRRCIDLSQRLQIRDWYTDTESEAIQAILHTFNRQQTIKKQPQFSLFPSPLLKRNNAAACFQYGIRRIQERAQPGRKTLEFSTGTKIPAALLAIPPELASGDGVENHPAVAALCFVVAALDFYDMPEVSGPEQTHTDNTSPTLWWDSKNRNERRLRS